MMKNKISFLILLFMFNSSSLFAGEADVIDVKVIKNKDKSYTFKVTVKHADTGWNHYANKWEILDEKGNILGTRILHHPHENEQPFTRNLSGVIIPETIEKVIIQAHDSVHQYGGKTISVDLP